MVSLASYIRNQGLIECRWKITLPSHHDLLRSQSRQPKQLLPSPQSRFNTSLAQRSGSLHSHLASVNSTRSPTSDLPHIGQQFRGWRTPPAQDQRQLLAFHRVAARRFGFVANWWRRSSGHVDVGGLRTRIRVRHGLCVTIDIAEV